MYVEPSYIITMWKITYIFFCSKSIHLIISVQTIFYFILLIDWYIITQTNSWFGVQSYNVQNELTREFNNNFKKNIIT